MIDFVAGELAPHLELDAVLLQHLQGGRSERVKRRAAAPLGQAELFAMLTPSLAQGVALLAVDVDRDSGKQLGAEVEGLHVFDVFQQAQRQQLWMNRDHPARGAGLQRLVLVAEDVDRDRGDPVHRLDVFDQELRDLAAPRASEQGDQRGPEVVGQAGRVVLGIEQVPQLPGGEGRVGLLGESVSVRPAHNGLLGCRQASVVWEVGLVLGPAQEGVEHRRVVVDAANVQAQLARAPPLLDGALRREVIDKAIDQLAVNVADVAVAAPPLDELLEHAPRGLGRTRCRPTHPIGLREILRPPRRGRVVRKSLLRRRLRGAFGRLRRWRHARGTCGGRRRGVWRRFQSFGHRLSGGPMLFEGANDGRAFVLDQCGALWRGNRVPGDDGLCGVGLPVALRDSLGGGDLGRVVALRLDLVGQHGPVVCQQMALDFELAHLFGVGEDARHGRLWGAHASAQTLERGVNVEAEWARLTHRLALISRVQGSLDFTPTIEKLPKRSGHDDSEEINAVA